MPFHQMEHNEQRSVWIDDSFEDVLPGVGTTKVEINRHPEGMTDWQEPGDCYVAALQQGLWPDDDELRLMVVGIPPNSDHAEAYYDQCMSAEDLEQAVTILPNFGDSRTRSIIVSQGTPRRTAPLERPEAKPKPESDELFLVRVDAKLIGKGEDELDEEEQARVLEWRGDVDTPDEMVSLVLSYRETDPNAFVGDDDHAVDEPTE